jgi:hypothetical protein
MNLLLALALAALANAAAARTLPYVDSRGGDPVGRPGRPCVPDLLEKMFGDYGATARIPTLRVYGENDLYMGRDNPHAWRQAFEDFLRRNGF